MDQSFCQWFESKVELAPDTIALVFGESCLSYAALNCRANQLAIRLQELGVKPDTLVGISVERSLEMVIGLLAIIKAGGAYVPLDPSYPVERLLFMLEDTQVPILLTEQRLMERLPQLTKVVLVHPATVLPGEQTMKLPDISLEEQLIYVLYTSGSTGKPKGVAMIHRSLLNFISWQLQCPGIRPVARVLQFASLNFDVSFQEIFSTLLAGGTLILIPEDVRQDILRLWYLLIEEAVERIFIPPVVFQQFAEIAIGQKVLPFHLREIVSAGEQLRITPAIVNFVKNTRCVVHNQYGPSENHGATWVQLLAEEVDHWPPLPPIGYPITAVRLSILDEYLHQVYTTGELFISGIGLARGYFNRPDLTAERFLPDPFALVPGSRMYRTGDLVRARADGSLEFVGRRDLQLKVRGFRIEPAEIEMRLAQHPAISQAVVLPLPLAATDTGLLAYLLGTSEHPDRPSASQLRLWLQESLPDYMLPARFLWLSALPLTVQGKLDRQALLALPLPASSLFMHEGPSTPTEATLASLWAQVLNLNEVGIHDNFFELGGHSLLATQVLLHIRQLFHLDLPLQTFFEAPSVAELASTIDAMQWVISSPTQFT